MVVLETLARMGYYCPASFYCCCYIFILSPLPVLCLWLLADDVDLLVLCDILLFLVHQLPLLPIVHLLLLQGIVVSVDGRLRSREVVFNGVFNDVVLVIDESQFFLRLL